MEAVWDGTIETSCNSIIIGTNDSLGVNIDNFSYPLLSEIGIDFSKSISWPFILNILNI